MFLSAALEKERKKLRELSDLNPDYSTPYFPSERQGTMNWDDRSLAPGGPYDKACSG